MKCKLNLLQLYYFYILNVAGPLSPSPYTNVVKLINVIDTKCKLRSFSISLLNVTSPSPLGPPIILLLFNIFICDSM